MLDCVSVSGCGAGLNFLRIIWETYSIVDTGL